MSLFGKKKENKAAEFKEDVAVQNEENNESFLDGMFSSQADDDFASLLDNTDFSDDDFQSILDKYASEEDEFAASFEKEEVSVSFQMGEHLEIWGEGHAGTKHGNPRPFPHTLCFATLPYGCS